jgi:hypothetical protein
MERFKLKTSWRGYPEDDSQQKIGFFFIKLGVIVAAS